MPLCMEVVPSEPALSMEQNDATPRSKPDALAAKLCTGMTVLLVEVVFLYRLLRHPKTPWYTRVLIFFPVIYLCSPIQLIPNFIPVLGQMDDVFVIWITKKIAWNLVDEKTWRECRSAATATRLPFSKQTAVSLANKTDLSS